MSVTTEPVLKGGCKCGAISYATTALPLNFTNCHCSTCRKLSGSPFITFGEIPTTSITFVGSVTKTSYSELAERAHCSKCGTPIFMQYNCETEVIEITAGSIDEGSVKGALPAAGRHIFLGEKAGWYVLPDDGLERYEGFPEGFQRKLDEWKTGQAVPKLEVEME